MSRYIEIQIDYQDLVRMIKSSLVQDENAQAPIEYDIDCIIVNNSIRIFITKEDMIGEFRCKIIETLSEEKIVNIIRNYMDVHDYNIESMQYIGEKPNKENLKGNITGVNLKLTSRAINRSVIKEL